MFHFPQPFLGWTNTPHSLGYTFPQYSLWTPLPIFFFFLLFANKSQMRGNRKKKKKGIDLMQTRDKPKNTSHGLTGQ